MNLEEISQSMKLLWEQKPGAVVLLILGFCVFLFLVIDTWRHKRHRRRMRAGKVGTDRGRRES